MDAKAILDGLLEKSQQATKAGIQMAEDKKLIPPAGDERTSMLKGAGAGALAAGAIALLFGSKGTRKIVGKAAKLGGTAAIGGLAYKAYTDWQAQQNQQSPPAQLDSKTAQPQTLDLNQFDVGTPINELSGSAASARSESLVQAMITAARADGHVDDAEMDLITQQVNNFGLEQDVTASAMVVDLESPEERIYLDSLAAALKLDSQLVAELEAPLRA